MQVSIYSNGSQECERAASLLKAVHLDEVVVYEKGKHFTEGQFRDEYRDEVEYPMISIAMFRGTLKETMNFITKDSKKVIEFLQWSQVQTEMKISLKTLKKLILKAI